MRFSKCGILSLLFFLSSTAFAKLGDPTATGRCDFKIDNQSIPFSLNDGFDSETDFYKPQRAIVVFAKSGAKENSNPRRFKLVLNATEKGTVVVNSDDTKTSRLVYIARGGQNYPLRGSCHVKVTKPYTNSENSKFKFNFKGCVVGALSQEYTISAKCVMLSKPYRSKKASY